jgi:hypothetical protein
MTLSSLQLNLVFQSIPLVFLLFAVILQFNFGCAYSPPEWYVVIIIGCLHCLPGPCCDVLLDLDM